jgi:hypothetical protein
MRKLIDFVIEYSLIFSVFMFVSAEFLTNEPLVSVTTNALYLLGTVFIYIYIHKIAFEKRYSEN